MKIRFDNVCFDLQLVCNKYLITNEQLDFYHYVNVSDTVLVCYSKTLGDLTSFCNFKNDNVIGEYGLVGNTLFHKISVNSITKLYRTYDVSSIKDIIKEVPLHHSLPYEHTFGKVENVFENLYFEVDKDVYFYYLLQGNKPLFNYLGIKK